MTHESISAQWDAALARLPFQTDVSVQISLEQWARDKSMSSTRTALEFLHDAVDAYIVAYEGGQLGDPFPRSFDELMGRAVRARSVLPERKDHPLHDRPESPSDDTGEESPSGDTPYSPPLTETDFLTDEQFIHRLKASRDTLAALLMRVSLCGGGVLIRGGDAKGWWEEVKRALPLAEERRIVTDEERVLDHPDPFHGEESNPQA